MEMYSVFDQRTMCYAACGQSRDSMFMIGAWMEQILCLHPCLLNRPLFVSPFEEIKTTKKKKNTEEA